MTLIIENSFSLNNYISISNRIIKNIPYYYLYFFPVIQYKNLDQKFKILISSNSNLVNKDIFYKLLYFHHNKFYSFKLSDTYFSKNLYHIFFSLNILRKNHISFLIDDDSLIFLNNDHQLPLLHNYSYSFYFPIINFNNLKMYFHDIFLSKKYVSIDIFIISYMIKHKINKLDNNIINSIVNDFLNDREKYDKNIILSNVKYLENYDFYQIIKFLFKFKTTWSFFSFSYFMLVNHLDLILKFSLYDFFFNYIHLSFINKERLNHNLFLSSLHDLLFII